MPIFDFMKKFILGIIFGSIAFASIPIGGYATDQTDNEKATVHSFDNVGDYDVISIELNDSNDVFFVNESFHEPSAVNEPERSGKYAKPYNRNKYRWRFIKNDSYFKRQTEIKNKPTNLRPAFRE